MGKTEADGCKKLEVWFLKKHGYFSAGYRSGTVTWTSGYDGHKSNISIAVRNTEEERSVQFIYTFTESQKAMDYRVPLETTPCHFGGVRYWFRCPFYRNGRYCDRRVGVLYLAGSDYFACRHCYDLTYESRNYHFSSRLNPLFRVLEVETKIEKLEPKVKRRTWRGRPTRKQRKLDALYRQAGYYYQASKGKSAADLLKD